MQELFEVCGLFCMGIGFENLDWLLNGNFRSEIIPIDSSAEL